MKQLRATLVTLVGWILTLALYVTIGPLDVGLSSNGMIRDVHGAAVVSFAFLVGLVILLAVIMEPPTKLINVILWGSLLFAVIYGNMLPDYRDPNDERCPQWGRVEAAN
jgi:uncharacterized membrane protein YjfL (UPF0719 family)